MKKAGQIKNLIFGTFSDPKMIFIRLVVGVIFLSEGILKFKMLEWLGPGRFTEIGFSNGYFWAYFTGTFEIVCGILVITGFLTRLASIPLIVIMITALITVKLPLVTERGFWTFAHEYTTDFALTMLLILILRYGGGKWSVDGRAFKI
ncbi:MAG: DoxX family protein [Bacteroidales bacterium]|nr:DoxX family protein [Bacteroidales bacterium]